MNLTPLNLAEEKKKFFFDPEYNPQFVYEQPISEEMLYTQYGVFGGELALKAKQIMDTVMKKWEKESKYLEEIEGRVLGREEATAIILNYLKDSGLEKKVTLHFSSNFIPRTHIDGYRMNIRLPIDYREKSIRGMLHHEIGTHVYRRLNDEKQIWHAKRKEFGLGSYLETEEGLAVLHYYLEIDQPYLWIYAVQYYACFLASTMSFSQVYKALKPYIDEKDRRFKITLRAKRGVVDTSKPGGYTKDQVYMRGVLKVAEWLRKNDFSLQSLYFGKVSIEDLPKILAITPDFEAALPLFYSVDRVKYKNRIKEILKVNGL